MVYDDELKSIEGVYCLLRQPIKSETHQARLHISRKQSTDFSENYPKNNEF